jgi:Bacterial archaeo-eukaryotic release factor family 3
VTAFRHAPRYLLLLLAEEAARFYDGSGRRLAARAAGDCRVLNPWRGADPLPVGFDVDASVARSSRQRAYLRRVDDALDHGTAGSDLPVVLAGPRHLTAAFLATTTQPERVIGAATSSDTALEVLGRLAHRLIQNHAAREEQEAVAIRPLAWAAVSSHGGNIIVVPEGTLGDFDGIALITDGGM